MYLTPFSTFDALSQRDAYIVSLPEARIAANYRDLSVRAGLAGFYITTVVLLAPLLLVLRRWRPPFGTATLLFTATALLVSALEEFRLAPLVIGAATAGLLADGLIRWLRPWPARVGAYGLFAALVPVALWGAYFATVSLVWGTWWTINLVGGAIGISSLTGLDLAVLGFGLWGVPVVAATCAGIAGPRFASFRMASLANGCKLKDRHESSRCPKRWKHSSTTIAW
jgi:hypothetical protein